MRKNRKTKNAIFLALVGPDASTSRALAPGQGSVDDWIVGMMCGGCLVVYLGLPRNHAVVRLDRVVLRARVAKAEQQHNPDYDYDQNYHTDRGNCVNLKQNTSTYTHILLGNIYLDRSDFESSKCFGDFRSWNNGFFGILDLKLMDFLDILDLE